MTKVKVNRWTDFEENEVVKQVKVMPHNLSRCFAIVSENLADQGFIRTPGAVAGHWYTVLSKRPDVLCFFTASSKHVCRNRKNGVGVKSNPSIWRKLIRIIHNLTADPTE